MATLTVTRYVFVMCQSGVSLTNIFKSPSVSRRRYRQDPRVLNWSSKVGLWGLSPSLGNNLRRLSRRACSLSLRFLGISGDTFDGFPSSEIGETWTGVKNWGQSSPREENDLLVLRLGIGELLCDSNAMSLKEPLRSTSLPVGETFKLSQEKVDLLLSWLGEHGADLTSFLITGNFNLPSEVSSSFVGDLTLFVEFVFVLQGIRTVNFCRSFLASNSMLFANRLCSFCIEALILWFVCLRSEFLWAQFLCFTVREEFDFSLTSIFASLSRCAELDKANSPSQRR